MQTHDWSIMPVQLEGEAQSHMRAVRSKGASMAKDAPIEVEIGSVWADRQGEKVRIPGQWRQCVVIGHEGAVVHARLSPAGLSTEPFG